MTDLTDWQFISFSWQNFLYPSNKINNSLSNITIHYCELFTQNQNKRKTSLIERHTYIATTQRVYSYYIRKISFDSSSLCVYQQRKLSLWPRKYFHRHCLRAHGLPTSFLNRLICIPGTCVSRHNMQMPRPSVSLSLSAISRCRASIFVKTSTYFAHPAPPFFLLPLFIIIFALRFHSINLFRFLYCARNPTRILLRWLGVERNRTLILDKILK